MADKFHADNSVSDNSDAKSEANEWFPQDYSPELSVSDWTMLLKDPDVFTASALAIMKRIKNFGGQATCTQLSLEYGESANFYNNGSSALARRVTKKTGCRILGKNTENYRWWPVLYVGKYADKKTAGNYIWKLRDELSKALDSADLTGIPLYAGQSAETAQPAAGSPSEDEQPEADKTWVYTKADFLNEVYMSAQSYDMLAAVLKNKKNIILQGAPGVGKTFAAKRLAYSVMGEMNESRIECIQFHQNYSYEDFILGYKPVGDGFALKSGVFCRFCQKAAEQPDEDFFFIIDEINRGNLSKIFGELLMLIERDYRGTQVTLAYNGLAFSVPENVFIIGMMNTADRSLAMIDYALRRRFSFFSLQPGFDSEGFLKYQRGLENRTFDLLIEKIKELNKTIENDKSLGKGFCIGHSYFCGKTKESCTRNWLLSIVDYDIIPMLSEYWFDDDAKLQRWSNILHGVF